MRPKNRQPQFGLTLIELMVAISVFALVLSIGLAMYLSIDRIQRTNLRTNIVRSDVRYWLDRLSEEIQTYAVRYDTSLPYPLTNPEDELHITNEYGQRVRYFLDDTDLDGAKDTLKRQIGAGVEQTLSSPEIRVNKMNVYIDPFVYSATDVPKVTVILQAQDNRNNDPIYVNLQTTASLRSY